MCSGRFHVMVSFRCCSRDWFLIALCYRESGSAAMQVRVRDFLLGTLAGMSPGILAVVLGNQLQRALQDPGISNITLLTGLALLGLLERRFTAGMGPDLARLKLRIARQKILPLQFPTTFTSASARTARPAACCGRDSDTKAEAIGLQEVDFNPPAGAKKIPPTRLSGGGHRHEGYGRTHHPCARYRICNALLTSRKSPTREASRPDCG